MLLPDKTNTAVYKGPALPLRAVEANSANLQTLNVSQNLDRQNLMTMGLDVAIDSDQMGRTARLNA
jgi:hypothetical protein